jgi:hypothetical protein
MTLILNNIAKYKELALTFVDNIATAHGYCPPTPTVIAELPKLK